MIESFHKLWKKMNSLGQNLGTRTCRYLIIKSLSTIYVVNGLPYIRVNRLSYRYYYHNLSLLFTLSPFLKILYVVETWKIQATLYINYCIILYHKDIDIRNNNIKQHKYKQHWGIRGFQYIELTRNLIRKP